MRKKPFKIITLGDERLKETSRPVEEFNSELKEFTDGMFRSLAAHKGLGLAAVQVGRLIRLFVTRLPEDEARVFVNPTIIETSEEQSEIEEGCLSVPKIYERLLRPARVKVQAFTVEGKPFTLEAPGLMSRVIQHELDHLNGVLFIDRIGREKRDRIVQTVNGRQAVRI